MTVFNISRTLFISDVYSCIFGKIVASHKNKTNGCLGNQWLEWWVKSDKQGTGVFWASRIFGAGLIVCGWILIKFLFMAIGCVANRLGGCLR